MNSRPMFPGCPTVSSSKQKLRHVDQEDSTEFQDNAQWEDVRKSKALNVP